MTYISQKPTTKGISFPPSLVLANVYIILFNFSFSLCFFYVVMLRFLFYRLFYVRGGWLFSAYYFWSKLAKPFKRSLVCFHVVNNPKCVMSAWLSMFCNFTMTSTIQELKLIELFTIFLFSYKFIKFFMICRLHRLFFFFFLAQPAIGRLRASEQEVASVSW